ncbi:MAG: hypothetical protein ABII23_07385 [bacterium]
MKNSALQAIQLLIDDPGEAQDNMDRDEQLLLQCDPVIRFYSWKEKSFSIGYFQSIVEVRKCLPRDEKLCPIVKRITGGGAVKHGNDLTFSIVLPDPAQRGFGDVRQSYYIINDMIASVIKELDEKKEIEFYQDDFKPIFGERKNYFCFDKPTRFDLMYQGQKIGGGAQRRPKGKFLHQGSLKIHMKMGIKLQFIQLFHQKFISLTAEV